MHFATIIKLILVSFFVTSAFTGCGEGSSSSATSASSAQNTVTETNTTSKIINKIQDPLNSAVSYADLFSLLNQQPEKTALIVDGHGVEGLRIVCGDNETVSEVNGLFQCDTLPLNIYLGNFKVGSLSEIPKDKVIFTQDILNLPRAATMHPDVTKLSMLLQSLDEDADLTNGITITQESINLVENELANFTDIQHLSIEDTNTIIESVIRERKAANADVKLQKVSQKDAQINLTEALANTPAKSLNITSFHTIAL